MPDQLEEDYGFLTEAERARLTARNKELRKAVKEEIGMRTSGEAASKPSEW